MAAAGPQPEISQRELKKRTDTLIPVTLRLLDETGRHRIAETMFGIAVELSGLEMRVSVMGRSGRPLSKGLPSRQKILVSFLATELHENVESLVCELDRAAEIPRQPDAWDVRLKMPSLMPQLADEVLMALRRYGRPPTRRLGLLPAVVLALAASLTTYHLTNRAEGRNLAVLQEQAEDLKTQLTFSNTTVNELAKSLEEADLRLDAHRAALVDVQQTQVTMDELRAERDRLADQLRQQRELTPLVPTVTIRTATLADYRVVRMIRGPSALPRLAYREGRLDLMGSSTERQQATRMFGRLISAFAQARGIDLRSHGSWSLESEDGSVGLETEEAFVVGPRLKDRPDFVFEARNFNRGPWLSTYAKLKVNEIWTYHEGRLSIWRLVGRSYRQWARSAVLPDLDPSTMSTYLARRDQTDALREFTQQLKP